MEYLKIEGAVGITIVALLGVLLLLNFIAFWVLIIKAQLQARAIRYHQRILIKQGYFLHRYMISTDDYPTLGKSGTVMAANGIIVTDHMGNVVGNIKRNNPNEPVLRLAIVE